MTIKEKLEKALKEYKKTSQKQKEKNEHNSHTVAFDMGAIAAFETAIDIALEEENKK